MLHPWTLEYQHMMLCVWGWIYLRKQRGIIANWRRPPGRLRNVYTSTGFRMQTLCHTDTWYRYCCGDLRLPEATERRNGSLGRLYATTTMMMKDDLCQKWRVKLIFQGTYRLSGTKIVECLKIIDVGCNLRQFDVEADRRCIFHFRP